MYMVLLCRDYDGKVTTEEVASAAMYLKDTLGKEGIQEIISNLSKDRGKQCCFILLFCLCFLSLTCDADFNPRVLCRKSLERLEILSVVLGSNPS